MEKIGDIGMMTAMAASCMNSVRFEMDLQALPYLGTGSWFFHIPAVTISRISTMSMPCSYPHRIILSHLCLKNDRPVPLLSSKSTNETPKS